MHFIALDKDTDTKICLFLVQNVKNVAYLRQNILSGKLNCCLVKPALILSELQITIAANKSAITRKLGKLVTNTVNSELLFNISPSKNITYSFQTFGAGQEDTECILVIFEDDPDKVEEIKSQIDGEFVGIEELSKFSDEKLIQKTYKITDEELNHSSLLGSILTRIAIKELDLNR